MSCPRSGADTLAHVLARRQLLLVLDNCEHVSVSAADAATIILDGMRAGAWRILVGEDARKLDEAVRGKPEVACDYAELCSTLTRGREESAARPRSPDRQAKSTSLVSTVPAVRPGAVW